MSGFRPFTRQLGAQPGVQLNPLLDNTDGAVPDNSDQVFAVVGRFARGRIDRAFAVDRSNFMAKTGPAESIRINALNEAKLQCYEALNNGAYQCVISRLAPVAAAKSYAMIDLSTAVTAFTVGAAIPGSGYHLAVLDHECFNDGIKLSVHSDSTPVGGTAVANKVLTLRVMDALGNIRYEFTGSLDPAAKDDFGQSAYLPDLVAEQTDNIEVTVATGAAGVLTTSDAYGRGTDGKDKWVTSSTLVCFSEGGTTYATTDYDRCIEMLRSTTLPFGYLISGGTQVTTLLGKLAAFASEINTPFKWDVPGNLTPSAVITFAAALGFDNSYCQGFWAPLMADDPMNGGKQRWGTAGLNVGLSCARNARINAKGFAPKNQPVAGKDFALNRTGVVQTYKPTEQELSDLAKVQINPVIFQTYNGGGRYVFTDCLTGTKSQVSYKKLATVAEMAATIDNWVAMYSNECLMLPMKTFIKRMNAFLETLLEGAEASDWLVKSKNLPNNAAFDFSVVPSSVRPADLVLVTYWVSYDGVARQVVLQQVLSN
jgi:hypothetical protein